MQTGHLSSRPSYDKRVGEAYRVSRGFAVLLRALRHVALLLAPWVLIVLLWYGVRVSGLVNPVLVPPPHRVAAKLWELLAHERLVRDIAASTLRVIAGV